MKSKLRTFTDNFLDLLDMTLRNLRGYGLRSFLSLLGISIGIFAIVLVFSLVRAMQEAITMNLSKVGSSVLYVTKWPWKDNSDDWFKYIKRPQVSYREYLTLKNRLKNADAAAFEATYNRGLKIKSGGLFVENADVKGITEDYYDINRMNILYGRWFVPYELQNGAKVCVVGSDFARQMFETTKVIGKHIDIKNKRFKIIGVLQEQGTNLFGSSLDDDVFIPYRTFGTMFNVKRRWGISRLIIVRALSPEKLDDTEAEIVRIMRHLRRLRPGQEDNFAINKQEALMKSLESVMNVLKQGGFFISIFSLLIGGFGIANIMLVNVRERTREIGIMKALGAKQSFILANFLLEGIELCLLGGLGGFVLVILSQLLINYILKMMEVSLILSVNPWEFSFGIGLSVLVGVLSAYFPARYAASLDPIKAIRS